MIFNNGICLNFEARYDGGLAVSVCVCVWGGMSGKDFILLGWKMVGDRASKESIFVRLVSKFLF